jgi:hypothetical protein
MNGKCGIFIFVIPRCRPIGAVAMAAALALAAAAPASPAATSRSPATAATKPAPVDEKTLAKAALADLERSAKDGNYAALESRVRTQMLQRLAIEAAPFMPAMNDMVYALRSCRNLAMADEIDPGRRTSRWLAGHREAARLLWRAMEDSNEPRECLRRYSQILAADEKNTLAYANLAVAFATARPLEHYVRQPRPATLLEAFAFYANANAAFRYDLKAMPYEFSRYLADTRLSLAERQWARRRNANESNVPAVYFRVPYDEDYFFNGKPKKITRAEYTLENLARLGGICIDQAYFASESCKAMGMPAAIIHGHGIDGGAHSWLAALKIEQTPRGPRVAWDMDTARYPEHKYYTGTLRDPAGGQTLHDSELRLLGWAALLPLEAREEADAATTLAAMAAEASDNLAPDSSAKSRASRATFEKQKENLLLEAVTKNLAHRRAWELAIRLRQEGKLSTEYMDRLFDFLVDRTAKDFPDYSCAMMLQVVPTYEPARREKIYQRAIGLYDRRPDLQGRLQIALGDDYAARGEKELALKTYQGLLASPLRELTELLLLAAQRAGDQMVADNHRDQAIDLYSRFFSESAVPGRNGAYRQTAYYQLGKRLAELLQDDNQPRAASEVLQKIGDGSPA